jgi:hypothetical protein
MVHTLPVALQVCYICTEAANNSFQSFLELQYDKGSKYAHYKSLYVFLYKMDLKETGREGMGWIQQAQSCEQS